MTRCIDSNVASLISIVGVLSGIVFGAWIASRGRR
jgi:hypothetical protein